MTPPTPDDGGEPTPLSHPVLRLVCPQCGYEFPPLVRPAQRTDALIRKAAPSTKPFPVEGDRRTAETIRIEPPPTTDAP